MILFENVGIQSGENWLFKGFNLEIQKGETVLLKGASGSGKSTLLHMVPGFRRPDQGRVELDGLEVNAENIKPLRMKLAYVPQNLGGRGPVRELVRQVFDFRGNQRAELDLEAFRSAGRELGLKTEFPESLLEELSGGERQRVYILIAIFLKRSVLLLDEITSALDEESRERVIKTLGSFPDITILGVSHDENWLRECDRVVNLSEVSNGHN